jgi:hypothetical protein
MEIRDIKPEEILADTLYGGDDNVTHCKEKGVSVVSPVSGKKSSKDFSDFQFDTQTKQINHCPNGKSPISNHINEQGVITAKWNKKDCFECPLIKDCQTKNGASKRSFSFTEKELRLWQRRQNENNSDFKDKYRYRSGIEGTNSRFIHMTGARRVRYRGLERVEYAETMKALGINMFRVAKYKRNISKNSDSLANLGFCGFIFSIFSVINHKIGLLIRKYSINSIIEELISEMI